MNKIFLSIVIVLISASISFYLFRTNINTKTALEEDVKVLEIMPEAFQVETTISLSGICDQSATTTDCSNIFDESTKETEMQTLDELRKSAKDWGEQIKFREVSLSGDVVATVIVFKRPRTETEIGDSVDDNPLATIERIDIFTPQTGTTTIADTSFDKLGVSKYYRPVFSPDGNYLFVSTLHYESESSFYYNRKTGKIIDTGEMVFQGSWYDWNAKLKIFWSPDNTKMIVQSTGSVIGYGNRAVYYSKTGAPEDLQEIIDLDKFEFQNNENDSVYIKEIYDTSVTNNQLDFKAVYSDESIVPSSYIFETGEFLNLK